MISALVHGHWERGRRQNTQRQTKTTGNLAHESVEGLCIVSQAKDHTHKFGQTRCVGISCFCCIFEYDGNVPLSVDETKHGFSRQIVGEIMNMGS